MKNLRIKSSGEIRENVDNAEAAKLVSSGEAVEVPAKPQLLGHRDPVKVENRDPIVGPAQ